MPALSSVLEIWRSLRLRLSLAIHTSWSGGETDKSAMPGSHLLTQSHTGRGGCKTLLQGSRKWDVTQTLRKQNRTSWARGITPSVREVIPGLANYTSVWTPNTARRMTYDSYVDWLGQAWISKTLSTGHLSTPPGNYLHGTFLLHSSFIRSIL